MLKIGLTGGIGSGKSTVARIFEVLNIPVYYADNEAKHLMNTDVELKQKLIANFGEEIYTNGELNRSALAQQVFNDKTKLEKLNSLVHPVALSAAAKWISKQTALYIIKEAALLFEAGANNNLDYVIGVSASVQLRIQRVVQRDGVNKEAVEKRMKNQLDEVSKMNRCDFVINNDETELLIPQVLKLHQHFIAINENKK